jgi:hypothetical protein
MFGTNSGIVYGTSGSINNPSVNTSALGITNSSWTFTPAFPSGSIRTKYPFKATIEIDPAFSDKLCLINLDYAHAVSSLFPEGPGYGGLGIGGRYQTEFDVNIGIANITINSGRQLPNVSITGGGSINYGGGGAIP